MKTIISMFCASALVLGTIGASIASAPEQPPTPHNRASIAKMLAQLTPEQKQACETEKRALEAQLQACGNDAQCQARIRDAIAIHNARCQG